ncbi:NAD(P)/FAD-dependent oxidoreductase [Defluviimonas sp. WL0002]|uniref:NAD(P)/FAD-dependent oxidoreductase n=1 Tax=Albidovulum marisflavi TaxID=2984159 RepID=A0ABT2ZBD0_9RHOB|nr:NAD(P)/FAD-dependent oxidoreductase [Defluviimonas sp. WL0002]MCV2868448.1 NAD(P)/FAD-dependent oxidoreductase [Defluviimonas sp. WL0002]
MSTRRDAIIIGAGPAGLAMSRSLIQRGIDHAVLERGRIGERWHSERWPGLRLLTPNWMNALPGMGAIEAPDAFMAASRFAHLLGAYGNGIAAPVITECDVLSVMRAGRGFRVVSTNGEWTCRSVVLATGACDRSAVPAWAGGLPDRLCQLTPSSYRGPDALPSGGVLVVGASATGVQLAAEIRASGRPVTISTGRHVRAPRRYRGRDLFHWLDASGFLYEPRSRSRSRPVALPSLQLIGSPESHEISLAALAGQGVRIAGRTSGLSGDCLRFAPTLAMECAAAEVRRRKLMSVIDGHILSSGIDAPADAQAWTVQVPPTSHFAASSLSTGEFATVIWATGFRRSYPWLQVPVLDASGEVMSDGGHTPVAGFYTLGLPFMRHRSSAFIYGFGPDAEAIAASVSRHLDQGAARAA